MKVTYNFVERLLWPSSLGLYEEGHRVAELQSTRGIRQGMVLGPLLFAITIKQELDAFIASHRVQVVAYLDDITLIGEHEEVQRALRDLEPVLQRIGLSINWDKTHVLWRNDHTVD
ncbi:hypothetical protein AGDE_02139, partial [Angomonas deanei]